ncbi:MAG: peptide-methionine (S)-S-oxide reductase MsrA [Candidatus Eisenbacteria bacterium]
MSEVATLAGGCFWCLEAVFERLEGVERVESGFSGGDPRVTTYREVCEGTSGHAEVVQVTYDPAVVSYAQVLELFFVFHDPTTLNRQGADVGTQYRSAIFTHSPEQERIARAIVAELSAAAIWPDPIVTEIVPFAGFLRAEDHHQGYYRQNSDQPYCRAVIGPKVAKLRTHFAERLKAGA